MRPLHLTALILLSGCGRYAPIERVDTDAPAGATETDTADPGDFDPDTGLDTAPPTADPERDWDRDGYERDEDCDDLDPAVNPGAKEICDGVDTDCDGELPADELDADSDGQSICEGDCDDSEPLAWSGASELLLDEIDNDCDGTAGTLTCTLSVPEDHEDVAQALAAASPGGVVCVGPGVWPAPGDWTADRVHLVGVDGASETTLQGGEGRVLTFQGTGDGSVVEGFSITGGVEDELGGGIAVFGGSPTLARLDVFENAVEHGVYNAYGGGLYLEDSAALLVALRIWDNELHANAAYSALIGGGLYVSGGSPALHQSEIQGHRVYTRGSGLYARDCMIRIAGLEVRDNTVGFNETSGGGGGISLVDCDSALSGVWVVESALSSWSSEMTVVGGGVGADGGRHRWRNLRIEDNRIGHSGTHAAHGSGIWLREAEVWLENAIVAGNAGEASGGLYGGGIFLERSQLSARQLTLRGNSAEDGGGLWLEDSRALVVNSAITENQGSGVRYGDGEFASSGLALYENSPVDGAVGDVTEPPGWLYGWGDSSQGWDLHLSEDSPLIDAGLDYIQDPDSSAGDIGAYGGPRAATWDLDRDGHPEWWRPGEYDDALRAEGWDPDDSDPEVGP